MSARFTKGRGKLGQAMLRRLPLMGRWAGGRRDARGAGAETGSSALLPQARLSGPMPWVMAIMVALTVVATAGGLALGNLAGGARAELAGGLTVQVMDTDPARRDRQAEVALAILENDESVQDVRRVSDEELAEMLRPWLGELGESDGEAQGTVPIPALIDARLEGPVTETRLDGLRQALAAEVPSARVDAQSSWLAPVFDAIGSLQWLAIGLVLLLAVASMAAVWLAARTALGTNRETIGVIHLLGGTDGQIADIFQRSVTTDAALGGAAGLILGLLAVIVLGGQFAGLGSGLVAQGGLGLADWLVIALVPVAGAALAALTARLTVLAALRRML